MVVVVVTQAPVFKDVLENVCDDGFVTYEDKVNAATLDAGKGGPGGGGKRKRPKVEKLARRWAWLKGAGSYVHIVPYYASCEPEELRDRLERCHHVWWRESKGDDVRWRGMGCGEREWCPLCGSYRQLVLADEAHEAMVLARTGLEVWQGVTPESEGLKLVLTIPKSESARIDNLLWTDYTAWQGEVNKLFKSAYGLVRRWFGAGSGGVVSLDYAGETSPGEAHYHVNVYVFPGRRAGKRWVSVGRWVDKGMLAVMRADWCEVVNDAYGLALNDVNIKFRYLGNEGQLHHWMQYLFRHPMSDLWRGWQGVDAGMVQYKAKKGAAVQVLPDYELQRIADRLTLIPSHFKRIRWFGVFSDGQRSKTMNELGLEAVDMDAEDDGESDGWERDNERATFVRYVPDGVILRGGDGGNFFVPDSQICYKPSRVSIGKRKRWREPGGV